MKNNATLAGPFVLDPVEVESARIALAKFDDASTEVGQVDDIFVQQHCDGYLPQHHEIWQRLCQQQREHLLQTASTHWLEGARLLGLDQQRVPDVAQVNRTLKELTGWELRPVTGYLPPRAFFESLAKKIMPVTVTIRDPSQEGYLPEPDAFHDIFGHAPLCAVKSIAKMLERFGHAGVKADAAQRQRLTSVFWFTIEFGLINENGAVRILGAGLASSPDESRYCLTSPKVARLPFDAPAVASTSFEIDHFQDKLFVLDSLAQINAYLDSEGAPKIGCGGSCSNPNCASKKVAASAGPLTTGANALELLAVDHVRMHVGNALQARTYYGATYGFTADQFSDLTTGSRLESSHLMTQGDIRLLLTTGMSADHPACRDVARFGDGVADIAFTVADAEAAYEQALRNGAISAYEPREVRSGNNLMISAGIKAFGRCVHSLVSRRGECGDVKGNMGTLFAPGFTKVHADPINDINVERPCGLCALDHCVANVGLGQMNTWVDWYSQILGFKLFKHFDDKDISTKYSALMSKVMDGGRSLVKIPINEPAPGLRRSQVQEFLDWHDGIPGVQHLAFRTGDALSTVRELRRRGVAFLGLPDTYYEAVWDRVEGKLGHPIAEPHELVKSLGLLLDSDDEGYLLQVFTKPVQDRPTLFIEIICRKGATGFGKGNFKALFEALELEQERRGNL